MIIYGYTRVCSESGINGKESETQLFLTQNERNHIMYEDYSDSFDDDFIEFSDSQTVILKKPMLMTIQNRQKTNL